MERELVRESTASSFSPSLAHIAARNFPKTSIHHPHLVHKPCRREKSWERDPFDYNLIVWVTSKLQSVRDEKKK